jgi:hypothetical protein
MRSKAPKHHESEPTAAEYLDPSDEEVQRAKKGIQDFLQPILKLATELLTNDYTDEQWAEIERALRHLQPDRAALENARERLVQAARLHNSELVNEGLGGTTLEKWIAKEWARIEKLSDDLLESLRRVATFEGHDSPSTPPGKQPGLDPYKDYRLTLTRLGTMAKDRLAGPKIDDGFPKATRRGRFHFHLLHVWTDLGGTLGISRDPKTGKIKGPLARYFAAATQPVCGGSLESLPDIVARQKSMAEAVEKWRAKMLIANGDSDAD